MTILATVIGIVVFLLLIFISIALHELGHLTAAKRYGVKCTEYMIGFGPLLWSTQRGETRYGFKLIPVGGYVRIVGMYPPARPGERVPHGRFAELVDEARQQSLAEIGPEDADRVFYKLPVRRRIVVMLAGPAMNLVLAFVMFTVLLVGIGLPGPSTTLAGVVPCVPTVANPEGTTSTGGGCGTGQATAAGAAGLQSGDEITAIDGTQTPDWTAASGAIAAASAPTQVTFLRDGQTQTRTVDLQPVSYPVFDDKGNPTGQTVTRTFLGVRPQLTYQPLSVGEVPGYMWEITTTSVGALLTMPQRLFGLAETLATNGERSPESPVSVVGVTRLGGEIAAADQPMAAKVGSFLGLAASLNLFLFLFNLLPVLPLDGGHVAAALWEATRRRWNQWRDRPDPGPVDTARLLPLTYSVAVALIAVGALVIWADIVKPITLGG